MRYDPSQFLLKIVFILALFHGVLGMVGLGIVIYAIDVLELILIAICFMKKKQINNYIKVPVLIFTFVVFLSVICNFKINALTIWGLRNNYRFILLLLSTVMLITEKNANWCIRVLEISFIPHILLITYQYVFLNYSMDLLGGIWGTSMGCNGGLLVYYCVLICIQLYKYDKKIIGLPYILISTILMCVTAAWAELKFFYVAMIALWVIYLLISKFSYKKFGIAIALVVIIPIANYALGKAFPQYENFLSFNEIFDRIANSNSYAEVDDIGRSSVFEKVPGLINIWGGNAFFGIGIGQADYSSKFSFFNSSFYNIFEGTHYTWLSTAFMMIEMGYIGLVAYAAIFVVLLIYYIYRYKKGDNISLFGILISCVCLMLLFYNSSLRTNYAYLLFFTLPLPLISKTDNLLDKTYLTRFRLLEKNV